MSKPKTERVTLLKPHTHHGKTYAKGDTIDVPARLIGHLAARGVIANPSEPAPGAQA